MQLISVIFTFLLNVAAAQEFYSIDNILGRFENIIRKDIDNMFQGAIRIETETAIRSQLEGIADRVIADFHDYLIDFPQFTEIDGVKTISKQNFQKFVDKQMKKIFKRWSSRAIDAINTYSQNFPQTLAEAEAEQVIAEMTDAAEIIFEVRRRLKVYSKDSTKIQLCGKKCKDVCDDWCKLLGCCGGSP